MGKDFLGQGWRFPIAVDEVGKIVLSSHEENIRESIRIILGTAKGERVMRADFGAGLHDFVFDTINSATMASVQTAIQNALLTWEPRIELEAVKVQPDPGEIGRLFVTIDYRVRATNTPFNLVFPFYLKGRI